MAITRRQFVTRLGALAAAVGMSQADLSKVTEAFAHTPGAPWGPGWTAKPKVIWVHGAECTGCSTSLLSLFEDARGTAVEGKTLKTIDALGLIVGGNANVTGPTTPPLAGHTYYHRTIHNSKAATNVDFDADANSNTPYIVTIQDVLIDFIDLQYHETVMGMGGDLAYQWLHDNMKNGSNAPFVLVVEGAVQDKANMNMFETGTHASTDAPWCSIGQHGTTGAELSFDEIEDDLVEATVRRSSRSASAPASAGIPRASPRSSGSVRRAPRAPATSC
jgi:hypothetical protein